MAEYRASYHGLVRQEIFPLVPHTGGRLLDVGGGVGATASALKAAGYVQTAGVIDLMAMEEEPSTNLDFRLSSDLEDVKGTQSILQSYGPFEVVLCLDVLEHLKDPWAMVSALHEALAPGGVIVASIPNISHYSAVLPLVMSGKWELRDAGILDRTHLRFFTRNSAVELMTSSGLSLNSIVAKASGGRRIRLFRMVTLGLLNRFTTLQYLIRVRRDK